VASRPPTISFSNILAFGGGVWGGAALKGKGNGGGMHARGHERVPRCNQTPMRTLKYRITTRKKKGSGTFFHKTIFSLSCLKVKSSPLTYFS